MPEDSTPRILATPIFMPPGMTAPTVASGTLIPAAAFGAPQTICKGCPVPASTWQTRSLSAFGCGSAVKIFATTIPEKAGATGLASSTSRPAMVKRCDRSSELILGLTSERSQDSGNCMMHRDSLY